MKQVWKLSVHLAPLSALWAISSKFDWCQSNPRTHHISNFFILKERQTIHSSISPSTFWYLQTQWTYSLCLEVLEFLTKASCTDLTQRQTQKQAYSRSFPTGLLLINVVMLESCMHGINWTETPLHSHMILKPKTHRNPKLKHLITRNVKS